MSNGEQSVVRRSIWRSLLWAVPLGGVLAAMTCVGLMYGPAQIYRSHSTLRFMARQPWLAFPSDADPTGRFFAESQIALLRSPHVIQRALESESLSQSPEFREIAGQTDPVAWVRDRLTVQRLGSSELYEVAFAARVPELAQRAVESIVVTYFQLQHAEFDLQRQRLLELLRDERMGQELNIQAKRERLQNGCA